MDRSPSGPSEFKVTTADLDDLPARPRIEPGDVVPRNREQFARLIRQFVFKEARYRLRGVR